MKALFAFFLLTVSSESQTDLDAWRLLHFPQTANDPSKEATSWGNQADPDADGYINLLEFLQDTDPNAFSDPLIPDSPSVLSFPWRETDHPVALQVETSWDAQTWLPGVILSPEIEIPVTATSHIVNRQMEGSVERILVRAASTGEDSRGFLRVRAIDAADLFPLLTDAQPFRIDDGLLTAPILQSPSSEAVNVVWYTAFLGSDHTLIYGDHLGHRATATSTKLTRMLEDTDSQLHPASVNQLGFPSASGVRHRSVWKHQATATNLTPGLRVPYLVESVRDDGEHFRSRAYSLQPLPAPGHPLKILLTSDQQNRPMSAANYQKAYETVGPLDAVLFAGDFVDYPNRASEWFDRNSTTRPPFYPTMQGRWDQIHSASPYRGGPILQHATLLSALGNHEVAGRWRPNQHDITTMYTDSQPRWRAEMLYENALGSGHPEAATFIRDHSFETITYDEMWPSPQPGLPYWSLCYGDIFIISLHVNRIWRLWGSDRKGKEGEDPADVNNPDAWGFGDHLFEPFGPGSAQYQWLEQVLESEACQQARFRIVMAHQTMFGLGDNAYPVLAPSDVTIRFDHGSGEEVSQLTYPISKETWDSDIAPLLGSIISIDYHYADDADVWRNAIEPLLIDAGIDLVLTGHSHLWNRSKVGPMHYLETSNVGDSFGARYDDLDGSKTWPGTSFPAGDPHGRPSIAPNILNPLQELEGYDHPLPFVSSNRHTVFSIFDTAEGAVKSYVFDTMEPSSAVRLFDQFMLE